MLEEEKNGKLYIMWVVAKIHTYEGRENASPNSKLKKQPPHYKINKT